MTTRFSILALNKYYIYCMVLFSFFLKQKLSTCYAFFSLPFHECIITKITEVSCCLQSSVVSFYLEWKIQYIKILWEIKHWKRWRKCLSYRYTHLKKSEQNRTVEEVLQHRHNIRKKYHFFLWCWPFISSTSFSIRWYSTVVSVS